MPYITFSRNLRDAMELHRILKKSHPKDSIVEMRGSKTVRKIAERAASKGFNSALIIIGHKGSAFNAQEIRIKRKGIALDWKFGKEKSISVKG
ncbi:MAG: hypothetical protein LVQ95_02575 [Candidatus Micrarchaeales archaeon]|nr:hypothetical protein [Candidatus Micrarchaeales archaeon]